MGILWYPIQGPSESSARVVATSGQMGKAADPAILLAAAIRAACLAKAPRRTVQGVAAAVAAVVMQASTAPLATDTGEPVKIPDAIGGISEDELALRLRLARAARRKAKRQRRRAAKAAAAMDVDIDDPQQVETIDDSQQVEKSGVASGGDTDPPCSAGDARSSMSDVTRSTLPRNGPDHKLDRNGKMHDSVMLPTDTSRRGRRKEADTGQAQQSTVIDLRTSPIHVGPVYGWGDQVPRTRSDLRPSDHQ